MALEEVFKQEDSLHFSDEFHNTYILKRVSQMRFHSVLTDVVLVVEGKEFPAHRNVLAASSDYFMAMFSGHMATSSHKVVLKEISSTGLGLLLDFIYKGEIQITEENVEDVFCGSCLLLLESVTQVCCKFIQERLTFANCWGIRSLSDKFNCNDLLNRATIFIEENFVEVAKSEEFLMLPPSDLGELLLDDELVISREEDLYELLLKWLDHDEQERIKHFPSLLQKIRLPQINPEYFEEIIATDELVIGNPEAHVIVAEARKMLYSLMEKDNPTENDCRKWETPRRCLRTVSVLLAVAGPVCAFYDGETEEWHNVAQLSTRHCPGIETMSKYVYVVGGSKEWKRMNACERYDPDCNHWQVMKPMNVSRSNIGLVALDGLLYAVGGYDGWSPIRAVECYNPQKDEWKFVAPMNNQRDGACVVTEGRYIFVISGYDGHNYLSSVEVYDPSSDTWASNAVAPIIERRKDAMAAVVENKVFVIGGYHGNTFMSTCEALDFDSNQWDFMASMSSPRYQAGVAVLNRKIYVCGGWTGNGLVTSLVECYDVSTNTWSMVKPLPTPSAVRTASCNFPRKMVDTLIHKERLRAASEGHLAQSPRRSIIGIDLLPANKPVTVVPQSATNIAVNQTTSATPVTHSQAQSNVTVNAQQVEAVKEQALKLKNFFSNLIRLASDQRSPDVGKTVKELVQGVMEEKLTEEEFAANLQTTLQSPPQPNLVGFLKKTLPMLRAQSRTQLLQQVPPSVTPRKILLQHPPKTSMPPHVNSTQEQKIPPDQGTHIQKIQIDAQQARQMLVQKRVILTPAQQQLLQRQQQLNQRVFLTTSTGATSGSQVASNSRNVVMVHAPPGTMGTKLVATSGRPQAGLTSVSASPADKLKPKAFTGISSSGDDDINDVTSMAGVNLMEESQRILAINSELLSSQTRSCKDEPFLNVALLQKKVESLVRKHGLTDVSQDVCSLVSHATQERLSNLLEKVSTISLHRLEVYRSRSRQEDPEQVRLKEKAKQMQHEEEELIRKQAANSTALAAIGSRKKRKLDEALEGTSSSVAQGSSSKSSPSSTSGLGNQN